MKVAYFTICTILITFIYLFVALLNVAVAKIKKKKIEVNYADGLDILMLIDLVAGWMTAIWAVFVR